MDQAVYLSYRIADFVPVLVLVVDYVLMHLNHVNQLAVVVESFLALQIVMNQEFVISDEQQLEMYSTYERLSKMKNLKLLKYNGIIQPTL